MLKIILLIVSTLFSAIFVSTVFNLITPDDLAEILKLSEGPSNVLKLIITRVQEVTFSIIDSVIYVANGIIGNEIDK